MAFLGRLNAIHLNSRFVEGSFEEVDMTPEQIGMDQYDKQMKLHDQQKVETKVDLKMKSDPIFGSLGAPEVPKHHLTAEQAFEKDLASRKPVEYDYDKVQHYDTVDSIAWAEKNVGAPFTLPKKKEGVDKVREEKEPVDPDSIDYDDDSEIESTIESAH